MKLLSVDSSAKSASVCITDDGKIISEVFVNVGLTHSQTLLPMIYSALKTANLNINDIEAFCTTTGPGSFTGIRIGTAVIKGLAHVDNKKCAGVSTLEAMAYNLIDADCVACCAMDARCNQVYTALFECENKKIKRLTQDIAISLEELYNILKEINRPIVFVGDGAEICMNKIGHQLENASIASEALRYQRAYGAVLAAINAQSDLFVPPSELSPVYLRPSQAERELKKKGELR